MNLSRFSSRNSRGILLATLLFCALGVAAFARMPAAILPDFPYPQLAIIVHSGELAIQDMVVRVTRPLEADASGVPGAKLVTSHTSRGATEMRVSFDWGTDMFQAYTRLNALVAATRSQLPPETDVLVEWITPSSFPIIGISMSSASVPVRDLRDAALLTVAPYLSRLDGVYRAHVLGGETREYQVLLDPKALVEQNVTAAQVNHALSQSNFIEGVGRFTQQFQSFQVLVNAQASSPSVLLDTVIDMRGTRPIRVRDVATVREGQEELTHIVVAKGHDGETREAVQIDIMKQPGASTAQVSDEVQAALAELQKTMPPGTQFYTFYDEANLLRESQGSLRDSIIAGGLLAMIVLLLALRSWRSTGIVLLCLPITTLIAFALLRWLGQTLNLMTLGGLAIGLGLIIDDVVVTLENIYRHLEMGKPPRQAALDGASEIQKPMIGSTITTVAVFLPLAFLGGLTGALYSPLSITLTILLLASVLLAVTFVPIVCSLFLRPLRHRGGLRAAREGLSGNGSSAGDGHRLVAGDGREATGDGGATPSPVGDSAPAIRPSSFVPNPQPEHGTPPAGVYAAIIRQALAQPWAVVIGAVLLGVCGVAGFQGLKSGVIPDMDEGAFVFDYLAPAGSPVEVTDRLVREAEQVIAAQPEVDGFCRRTGLELGLFSTDPNRGDIMVRLKPKSQRKRSATEVKEAVEKACKERLPTMKFETFAPIADRVGDIAGQPNPIEVKIYGEDPKVLIELAEKVQEILGKIKGVGEGAHEVSTGGPELSVRVNPQKAGMLGLSPQDVADTLDMTLSGRVERFARRGDLLIPIRALLPHELRATEAQIRRLPIYAKDGRQVALEDIADIREEPGAYEVVRENQKEMVPVTAVLNGGDLGTANREAQARITQEVHLPQGYSIQYGGLWKTQQEQFRNLLAVLLLGALLVYVITLFQYDSFAEPTCLVIAGAFALASVALALLITQTALDLASFTGGIMIFGMVMTNGIVLMDTIRNQVNAGYGLEEAITRAGSLRVRPVLMTSAIATLTLLPLAFGIGSGAEMQRPLAIAVIGGLVTSPLFTLVLAPTLLYMMRRRRSAPEAPLPVAEPEATPVAS